VIVPARILRITGLDNRLPIFTGIDWAGTGRYQEHFAGKWLNLLPSRGQRAAGRARRAVAALLRAPSGSGRIVIHRPRPPAHRPRPSAVEGSADAPGGQGRRKLAGCASSLASTAPFPAMVLSRGRRGLVGRPWGQPVASLGSAAEFTGMEQR